MTFLSGSAYNAGARGCHDWQEMSAIRPSSDPRPSWHADVAIAALGEPALVVDAQGQAIDGNDAFALLTGHEPADVFPESHHTVLRATDYDEGPADCPLCHDASPGRPVLRRLHIGEERIPVEMCVGFADADGDRVVTLRDLRMRDDHGVQMADRSRRDPLTGLADRLALSTALREAAAGHRPPFALLLIDLDGFKDINDRYGHMVGDAVLVAAARRLRGLVREGCEVVRYGGDELAVAVHEGEGVAREIADRVLDAFAEPFAVSGQLVRVGASIGAALPSRLEHADSPNALLAAADDALSEAKANGKGCVAVAGDPPIEPGAGLAAVTVADARAFAAWIRDLRIDIAAAMEAGKLPWHLGAPESIHRTLLALLATIDSLPGDRDVAPLPLPHPQRLLPFAIYMPSVVAWTDRLVERGVLSTVRPPGADRFWHVIQEYAETLDRDLGPATARR